MEANPWAAVVFLGLGVFVFRSEITNPTFLAIFFAVFVLIWLASGYVWDWFKYRDKYK